MSRQMHAVEMPEAQLTHTHKARLVASAVLIAVFTALVAFAPSPNPGADSAPAMTAAAKDQAQQ